MTRRCSHCSNNGHNSRTCPAARAGNSSSGGGGGGGGGSGQSSGGVKLFGVRLTEGVGAMKKSASMGNLNLSSSSSSHFSSASSPNNNPGSPGSDPPRDHPRSGYASDDPTHASCSSSHSRGERKKGTPWTEEEHKRFLLGLQKLGKGDWRGIARNFVGSRTPTQVASHAQKYFIRQTNASRRKRRSSLFDMVPEIPETNSDQLPGVDDVMLRSPPNDPENTNQLPSLQLRQDLETEPAEPLLSKPPLDIKESTIPYTCIPIPPGPTFFPAFIPLPYPFWPPAPMMLPTDVMAEAHEVLKPTPVLAKESRSADEVVSLSKLSIGDGGRMEPSALSHKLLEASASRQSAFHVNSTTGADLSPTKGSPIHAV